MSQPIQWFPGHMAKAKREAKEKLNLVDIVIELVDARIPESSRNPLIDEIVGNKPRIMVLNKADLADPAKTQAWINYYQSQGIHALSIDAQHGKGLKQLEKQCQLLMSDYFAKQAAKGVKPRAIRLMILGIPNVGKSTLINRFVGKNQAITGNKPGVTKAQRWLKVGRNFELLDTPGILWPKFDDPLVGKKLALTGAIKDQLVHMDDLALYLLELVLGNNLDVLKQRYRLTEQECQLPLVELLLVITKRLGVKEDYDQESKKLVIDYRQHQLCSFTLDQLPLEASSVGEN